jgi:hypothetical protein
MRKTSKMMLRLNKKGYNYDPKKNKFRTGGTMTMPRRYVIIVANMGISPMIVPNLQSSTRSKMMMTIKTSTQRKVKRRTSRRRGLSRERKTSMLFLKSGSPMENLQVMTQVMMNPRRKLWGLPCMMMMSHLYLHHLCVSWQEVTPR